MKGRKKTECKLKKIIEIPHIRMVIIIFELAVLSLTVSGILYLFDCSFWSSVLANIFAGLVTGGTICLISGIKQKSVLDISAKISWLQELSALIKIYFADYVKLMRLKFDKFNGDENLYMLFYDADIHANDVNSAILQKQFEDMIDFSPCKYVRDRLGYDAEDILKEFKALHEKVEDIDISCPSAKEILTYFITVDKELRKLNSAVQREIRELEKRLIITQRTII